MQEAQPEQSCIDDHYEDDEYFTDHNADQKLQMIMLMIALLTMIKFLPGADNGYDYTDDNGDDDDHHYHYDLGRRAESIVGTQT